MSDNSRMDKMSIRQILASRLRRAMVHDANIETQEKLAAKSGLSQSHISRLLLCEAAATTDALVALSKAIKCQPWELLFDSEVTRKAVIEQYLTAQAAPDDTYVPNRVIAIRRKKRGG